MGYSKIKDLLNDIDNYLADIESENQDDKEGLQQTIDDLQEEKSSLENQIEELKEEIENSSSRILELEEELNKIKNSEFYTIC